MEILIGLVIGAALGFAVAAAGKGSARAEARQGARAELDEELGNAARRLREGKLPEARDGSGPLTEVIRSIEEGWAPRQEERRAALRDAVGRVTRFLDRQVRAPLSGAGEQADAAELRERIERALGAIQDVDFFLADVPIVPQGTDLVALAQQVSREFASDHQVTVRLQLAASSIRATVGKEPLMDALYLILHNAARFGGPATIDMTVLRENGNAVIRIRDRGRGFSEEAFKRAFDPFYSESEDGLGLGLPHARKSVEAMGGSISVRNVPDGGAEVEVKLPG